MNIAEKREVWGKASALDSASQLSIEAVPKFVLYGDQPGAEQTWLLNVEPLAARCRERGWRIDLHRHPTFGQMVFVRSGSGTIWIEEQCIAFRSPCIMVVPIECVHGYSYEPDSDGWVLTVADHYLSKVNTRLSEFDTLWSRPSVINLPRDAEETKELRRAIIKLEREIKLKPVGHFIAAEALLTSIFLTVLRNLQRDVEQPHVSSKQAKLVQDFRALIELHYRQGWKISDFSAALAVSLPRLRTACEMITGETPIKMIHMRLLSEAKRNLLFTDMSIEQIAYWLGFSSTAYFARFFKNQVGQPPARYRRWAREMEIG